MFDTKTISFKDVAALERTFKSYAPLFSDLLDMPVTFEMGRRRQFLDVFLYYFAIKKERPGILADILYPLGHVWCNIIIDHARGSAKMMNMVTGRGYRKRGLQGLFQSVIYTTLQIGEVRFLDTYPDGKRYIELSGLFRDVERGPLIKKYPDVRCSVDMQRCRDRIALFRKTQD